MTFTVPIMQSSTFIWNSDEGGDLETEQQGKIKCGWLLDGNF